MKDSELWEITYAGVTVLESTHHFFSWNIRVPSLKQPCDLPG